jgi:two-component system, NarL family, response regulator NreC
MSNQVDDAPIVEQQQPQPPARTPSEMFNSLTKRERDVLRLVGQGYTAPEIGDRLLISPKTVDTYKQRIQEKLDFTHRSQYVQLALTLGLLAQDS